MKRKYIYLGSAALLVIAGVIIFTVVSRNHPKADISLNQQQKDSQNDRMQDGQSQDDEQADKLLDDSQPKNGDQPGKDDETWKTDTSSGNTLQVGDPSKPGSEPSEKFNGNVGNESAEDRPPQKEPNAEAPVENPVKDPEEPLDTGNEPVEEKWGKLNF